MDGPTLTQSAVDLANELVIDWALGDADGIEALAARLDAAGGDDLARLVVAELRARAAFMRLIGPTSSPP